MSHNVLAWKIEIVANTFAPEDFSVEVESSDGIGDVVECVFGDHITAYQIAKIEIRLKSAHHVSGDMAL